VFVWVAKSGSEYYLKARHLNADGGDVWNNPGWEDPHVAVLHTVSNVFEHPKVVQKLNFLGNKYKILLGRRSL